MTSDDEQQARAGVAFALDESLVVQVIIAHDKLIEYGVDLLLQLMLDDAILSARACKLDEPR